MCTKTKIWKSGQLVTIASKVYRVTKSLYGCWECANRHTRLFNTPCNICTPHRVERFHLGYQDKIILKELKPKQNK